MEDETISKVSDEVIRITKVIPEKVVNEDYSLTEIEEKIKRLQEEITMEEQMIAQEEENTKNQIEQLKARLADKKAELAIWEARRDEAIKILPKNGVCGAGTPCEVGQVINLKETETEYTWQCEGINGGTTADCKQEKPKVEEVVEPIEPVEPPIEPPIEPIIEP